MFNICWCENSLYSVSATSFLGVCWPLSPLIGGVAGLSGQGLPPSVEQRPSDHFLSCVCDMQYEVSGAGALPLREKPLRIPIPELVTVGVLSCHLSQMTPWHLSQPHRNCGNAAAGPGVSRALFSPGRHHPSTEVRAQVAVIMDLDSLGVPWSSSDSALAPPQRVHVHKVLSCKS